MSWEQELKDNAHLFPMDKKVFQPDEVALAYHIYNMHFGTMKRDTGCGACRREVVTAVKKLVLKTQK
jgi:hypothetical protein